MSDWISVKERVPEKDQRVLLGRSLEVTVGYLDSLGTWNDETEWVSEEGWHSDWRATHWQPLPDPPEEER